MIVLYLGANQFRFYYSSLFKPAKSDQESWNRQRHEDGKELHTSRVLVLIGQVGIWRAFRGLSALRRSMTIVHLFEWVFAYK
jgi:hypothetical protein